MFCIHCAFILYYVLDNSKFYCEVCDLGFSFKSAYERHVDSSKKHKLYAASLVPLENENLQFDEEIPSMLSPPFSSNDLEVSIINLYTCQGIVVVASIHIGLYPYMLFDQHRSIKIHNTLV